MGTYVCNFCMCACICIFMGLCIGMHIIYRYLYKYIYHFRCILSGTVNEHVHLCIICDCV